MTEQDPGATPEPEPTDPVTSDTPDADEPTPEGVDKPDLYKDLIDARRTLRAEKADLKKQLDALKAEVALKDKPAEEQALEAARAEARTEATEKANARIVRAEVKAAATGKVKNPALALKLIDTSEIDVDDDGEVDSDAVNQAITDLLEQYPELAADGSKFTGSADQGAKGKSAKPAQMTQAEFDRIKSNPHAVMKAKEEGLLNSLLGIETT